MVRSGDSLGCRYSAGIRSAHGRTVEVAAALLPMVLAFLLAAGNPGDSLVLDREGHQGAVAFDHAARVKAPHDPQSAHPAPATATCAGCHHTTDGKGVIQLVKCEGSMAPKAIRAIRRAGRSTKRIARRRFMRCASGATQTLQRRQVQPRIFAPGRSTAPIAIRRTRGQGTDARGTGLPGTGNCVGASAGGYFQARPRPMRICIRNMWVSNATNATRSNRIRRTFIRCPATRPVRAAIISPPRQ